MLRFISFALVVTALVVCFTLLLLVVLSLLHAL